MRTIDRPPIIIDPPLQSTVKAKLTPKCYAGAEVFIVYRWATIAEFMGVFTTVELAVKACTTERDCVCPAFLDVKLPDITVAWPGAWYPRLEPRPQKKATK